MREGRASPRRKTIPGKLRATATVRDHGLLRKSLSDKLAWAELSWVVIGKYKKA